MIINRQHCVSIKNDIYIFIYELNSTIHTKFQAPTDYYLGVGKCVKKASMHRILVSWLDTRLMSTQLISRRQAQPL